MNSLNNFFRPGEIIVERLAAAMPELSVRRVKDYAQAQREVLGSSPELLVRFLRSETLDVVDDVTHLDQAYTAFYAVPGAYEDWDRDGPVLLTLIRTMAGHEPDEAGFLGPYRSTGTIVPQPWEEQGVVVYPVTFSVPVRV